MYEPTFYNNTTKKEDFHKLLKEGKNICSTHALFTKADDITRQALKANNYILILDEVMNVVTELENFTNDDLKVLLNEKLAYIEDDFLLWNSNKLDYNGRYTDIKNMCLNKNLISIGSKLIFWNFPVDIFNYFDEIYILTYLFDAQIQKYYYDFHKVQYNYYQIQDNKLIAYNKQLAQQRINAIKPLINIYEGKLNKIGDNKYALSKAWFNKDDTTLITILQKNVYNWFNNINRKVKNNDCLWCTFKDHKNQLKGKGYTKRFLSINMRATNEYKNTYALAYCCNRFLRPTLKTFFSKKNINVNENLWALSEMIQWIWRSRIREGQEIYIYIPSKRMKENLQRFLENR